MVPTGSNPEVIDAVRWESYLAALERCSVPEEKR